MSGSLGLLEGYRYVRMVTYRRSGEGVPTTVWFALVDGKAYVFTGMQTGKAKRIRNNPRVSLTPSNFIGRPKVRSSVEAEARLMAKDEEELADRAIDEKYGWQYRLYHFVLGRVAPQHEHVFLELRPVGSGRE
ncbi:MAG TPA: PPOX class F420-dependent oxidoreductase [Rubrobacter sp.]|nr:PPOX class F420-dependent oxidoreductase [Rubrobacter sp.]